MLFGLITSGLTAAAKGATICSTSGAGQGHRRAWSRSMRLYVTLWCVFLFKVGGHPLERYLASIAEEIATLK